MTNLKKDFSYFEITTDRSCKIVLTGPVFLHQASQC